MEIKSILSQAYEKLDAKLSKIEAIVSEIKDTQQGKIAQEKGRMFTSMEVCAMLNISRRTLQRWRDKHLISYVIINGKCLFSYEEIQRVLKTNLVSAGLTIDDIFTKPQDNE